MTYRPRPPIEDSPLARYLEDELKNIEKDIATAEVVELTETFAPPVKLREGMIRFADGTNWNPGAGRGIYAYYDTSWKKLG